MRARILLGVACLVVVAAVGWLSRGGMRAEKPRDWEEVARGVYRTKSSPHSYAVVSGKKAILIDAAVPPDSLAQLGVEQVEAVLLTHHHRDTAAFAADFRKKGVAVRAAKESADWLTPAGVAKFWAESIPLRNSRTAYFVLPEGIDGVDCSLADGQPVWFGEWSLTPVATPGHSRDHLAFHLRPADDVKGAEFVFCGDAFCSPGKLWTPYTTDWDHWTDVGLKPTAESLRKLAKLNPSFLCPAHGAVVSKDIARALTDTAEAVEEVGFLKSFERFSKRLGDTPKYDFLVPKEQIASAGEKPWARISDHLWITGNTYVLKAKDGNAVLVLDPWGERSAKQIEKLLNDEKLGPIEVVAFSHAHYDHYDGVYVMPGRDRCQVWALDLVAAPLKDPFRFRAPFLDARPVTFTTELKDGETTAWGGYTFKFTHLPGQSWYTCGIETTIDGKRCAFTADNFFHQDQFSGSGGWMGLNRSSPVPYAASARKVLAIAPEWVLAEHGGPYVFNAEDYRRRVKWGEAAGQAADRVCVSGNHLRDWTPHRVTVEPQLVRTRPGGSVAVTIRVHPLGHAPETVRVALQGRGLVADQRFTAEVRPNQPHAQPMKLTLPETVPPGRHIFVVRVEDRDGAEPVDAFAAVDVAGP
jgi:glyoxylase-like metal-dependent hydrolase (beta-lactamase superfamily II)